MYMDQPYAREIGHVREVARVAEVDTAVGDTANVHDVHPNVFSSVVHWLQKGDGYRGLDPLTALDTLRDMAQQGAPFCQNDGCEVVGHLKEFKVCPLCKVVRYCGEACQKHHWTCVGKDNTQ